MIRIFATFVSLLLFTPALAQVPGQGGMVPNSPASVPGGANLNVQINNAGAFGGLTDTQLTARINAATAALSGALPAWPNNTATFFRGDGTYSNTLTSQLFLSAAGSAGNPVLAFNTCGTDCGWYAPAANQAAFSQGGAVKLDWNIGTAGRWTFYADLAANGNRYTGASSLSFNTGYAIVANGANSIIIPGADTAAPPSHSLFMQSVAAGTSNGAGANWTVRGSLSTGSGVSGDVIFQTGGTGAGATVQNTAVAALTLKGATQQAIFNGQVSVAAMTQSAAAQSGTICYNTTGGTVTYDATLGCLASSMLFKQDIHAIKSADALNITSQLKPVSFRKREEAGGDVDPDVQVGFLAEQVAEVDERLTARGPDGAVRGVRYQQLTAILAGAIQELKAENEALHACNDNWKCRLFGIGQ